MKNNNQTIWVTRFLPHLWWRCIEEENNARKEEETWPTQPQRNVHKQQESAEQNKTNLRPWLDVLTIGRLLVWFQTNDNSIAISLHVSLNQTILSKRPVKGALISASRADSHIWTWHCTVSKNVDQFSIDVTAAREIKWHEDWRSHYVLSASLLPDAIKPLPLI